jgi:branched-chain amino acid transport system permease protein
VKLFERSPGESLAEDRRVQAIGVAVVLVLAVVPFVTNSSDAGLIHTGLIFVMLGVSWNLLAGYAGQISLGHAAFFGMGAFVAAWLTTPTAAELPASIQLPVVVAILVGAVASALIALVIGPIIFRLSGHYFAIGTLALAAVIELVMADQRDLTGGESGYYVRADIGLGEVVSHDQTMFLLTLLATIVTVVVTYYIVRQPAGLGMKAVHDDSEAASSLGVNPLKYKMYAFVVSSFFAGLAGALFAHYELFIAPSSTIGVGWTIDSLVVVILGGMGTFAGPILGAGLFLLLDNGLRMVVGGFSSGVEGILIILFIIFLPKGLFGVVKQYLVEEHVDEDTDAE